MAEEAGPAERRRAAALALAAMAGLIAVKLALSAVTGSVAILADAHSAAILVASLVAALGARGGSGRPGPWRAGSWSRRPACSCSPRCAASAIRSTPSALGIAGMAASSVVAGLVARHVGAWRARRLARAAGRRGELRATSMTSGLVAGTLGLIGADRARRAGRAGRARHRRSSPATGST